MLLKAYRLEQRILWFDRECGDNTAVLPYPAFVRKIRLHEDCLGNV